MIQNSNLYKKGLIQKNDFSKENQFKRIICLKKKKKTGTKE